MHIRLSMKEFSRKTAKVFPVFQVGDKPKLESDQSISILPIISKVAEKGVALQLTLNNCHSPLHHMHFGFRKQHSNETATCNFFENIESLLGQGGSIRAVFLDF